MQPNPEDPRYCRLLRRSCLFQNLIGKIVLYRCLVADGLVVGGLQQLLTAVTKLLPYRLLHARVFQFALAGGLLAEELNDTVSVNLMAVGIGHRQHCGVLAGLQLVDRVVGDLVRLQRRLRNETQVATFCEVSGCSE